MSRTVVDRTLPPSIDVDRGHHDGGYSTAKSRYGCPSSAGDLVVAADVAGEDAVLARRRRVGGERDGDDGEAHTGEEHEEEQEAPGGHRCHLTDRWMRGG